MGAPQQILAARGTAAAGPTYLVNQGFEGTGYDNGESWTESGTGTKNEDYTTSPIEGSQSLLISSAGNAAWTTVNFTATQDVLLIARLRVDSLTGEQIIASFHTSGGTSRAFFIIKSDKTIKVQLSTGGNNSCTDALPTGTDLWIFLRFTAGSGADASAGAAWSSSSATPPSFVASGAQTCAVTGGGEVSHAAQLSLGVQSGFTGSLVYDGVQVYDP